MWLGNDYTNLIERSFRDKSRKCADPWHETDCREPRGDANHVLFGDARFEEAIRVGGGKNVRPSGIGKVAVENDELGITAGKLDERLSPHFTKRLLRRFGDRSSWQLRNTHGIAGATSSKRSSSIAIANSSSVGTLACQLKSPSM